MLQQISYIRDFKLNLWQVKISISREITLFWNVKCFQLRNYQANIHNVPKTKHDSKELLSKAEGWISPLEFRYAEDKNSQNSFQYQLAGANVLIAQPRRWPCSQAVQVYWLGQPSSAQRDSKWPPLEIQLSEPEPGRPGWQPAHAMVLLGDTDFVAQR